MVWAASLPPPEQLCGPFYSHSSGFIAAPGGSGKSMFSLGLAYALASGKTFCGWKVGKPLSVYMVDCEMSDPGLFGRLRSLGFNPNMRIKLDTSGLRDKAGMPRFELGNPEHLHFLMMNASASDVIVIDNVSACLTPQHGKDLFSPEAWQQVFALESWARREGKLLVFLDHTNKAGQLAGTMHKHRMADFVMLLERTSLIGEPWLEFLWSMDKCRYETDPDDVIPRLVRLDAGRWSHSDPMEEADEIYMQVISGTMTKKDAAAELDCTRVTL
jgi:putative DNA primase/helicase